MKHALGLAATIAAFSFIASGAMADSRFAAKNGTASGAATNNTDGCGLNSNTADATLGPCTTITRAYANAKIGGGPSARVIVSSNGVFQEAGTVTLDYAGGNSEIRVSGGLAPGWTTVASANTIDVNTPNDVRIFDIRINSINAGGFHGINVIQVNTLELHRTEMRGFSGNAVLFAPSTCPNPNTALFIADSDISGSSTGLILIKPSGSCTAGTAIKNSQIHHSTGYGVATQSSVSSSSNPVKTIISTSILANFSQSSVVSLALVSGGTQASTIVDTTSVLNANNGIASNGGNARVILTNAIVAGNATGLGYFNGGQIFSFGNSQIFGNGTNGADPTPLAPK